jgi:Transcriptional regulator
MTKNILDAKNRILQAAIKIFAAKSFEGSRIDEIAEEAGVPKSLIYYHFKSKDEILEVLIHGFIREYTGLLQVAQNDTHQSKVAELPERMQSHYRDFAIKNADLIRIILMDSLKKSAKQPVIYKIVEALVELDEKSELKKDHAHYDRNERLVAEFFTSLIPTYAYLCFYDSWLDYFKIEKEEFNRLFLKIYMATHGAYHQNHE